MAPVLALFSLSAISPDYLPRTLIFGAQIGYLWTIGYALCLMLTRLSPDQFRRLCVRGMWLLIAICAIELFTPMRAVFDQFRFEYYGARAYDAASRDILSMGGIRPMAFASEPSYLALYFGLMFTGALFTSTRASQRLWAIVAFVAGVALIRSPSLVAPIASIAVFYTTAFFSRKRCMGWKVFGSEKLLVLCAFYAALVAFVGVLAFGVELDLGRIESLLSGEDRSFISRIGAPAEIARRVIDLSPWFGAGAGGNEVIYPIMYNVMSQMQGIYFDPARFAILIGAPIVSHWTYFGIVGGLMMLAIYHTMFRRIIGKNMLLFWGTASSYLVLTGGYSYHTWIGIFFLAAIMVHTASLKTAISEIVDREPRGIAVL